VAITEQISLGTSDSEQESFWQSKADLYTTVNHARLIWRKETKSYCCNVAVTTSFPFGTKNDMVMGNGHL
jgi:hypothetical protein